MINWYHQLKLWFATRSYSHTESSREKFALFGRSLLQLTAELPNRGFPYMKGVYVFDHSFKEMY